MRKLRYRLALDLGPTSLGWAMIRLDADSEPCAIIKAGARIFSDGRNPKDGTSLAVTRREARAMRRRRDRLLRRKARLSRLLVEHGFFPSDAAQRKALERLDPYELRARGLDSALTPAEFARALFHINQRRGFKSNRRTDRKDSDSGALKSAITRLRTDMVAERSRTVGEWLHKRHASGQTVRARFRQNRIGQEDGKARIEKSYDLYIDRAMVEAEFDAYDATPAPKLVLAVGDCGCTGGIFGESYASRGRVANVIPVDGAVPGCPPPPIEILRGILSLVRQRRSSSGKR